eukprot:CAMPEP_0195034560 /NCGR_PEP_ID=MMETSP0326_2-20130528/68152_1 /TAXON_ID=2866 ORGANISM="Crypthecodinium cohnii, Strain Seligo" /NCGR_SAMPLE_ID=MMETSP0326_2 /ASSEMBLY_ACC=CAM_ASM_000348 /LENGTH=186 /DNA_ID=CAMNT_0040059427 /DNA_START=1 /DNA_END=561 /DNA_ORIENTATION=+
MAHAYLQGRALSIVRQIGQQSLIPVSGNLLAIDAVFGWFDHIGLFPDPFAVFQVATIFFGQLFVAEEEALAVKAFDDPSIRCPCILLVPIAPGYVTRVPMDSGSIEKIPAIVGLVGSDPRAAFPCRFVDVSQLEHVAATMFLRIAHFALSCFRQAQARLLVSNPEGLSGHDPTTDVYPPESIEKIA